MLHAMQTVFSKYATFSGQAARPEFWWWTLFVFLVLIVTRIIDYAVVMPMLGADALQRQDGQPLSMIVLLALLLPSLAVAVRRLHDTGRSGWWLLIGLIPIVGNLVLLWFYIQPGKAGPPSVPG